MVTNTQSHEQIRKTLEDPTLMRFDSIWVESIQQRLSTLKALAIKDNDQDEAKRIWCTESILKVQYLYVKAFSLLESSEYYAAWCTLEKVEIALSFLLPHHDISTNMYLMKFIDQYVGQFQSLFPYNLFISPELLETEKKCTICHEVVTPRRPCGHDVGEIYNGEMCCREVSGLNILGISVVTSPLQKYSVLFLSDKESGKKTDHYNYAVVEYVAKRLQSPWHGWSVNLTSKLHPHSKFTGLSGNSMCPCNSGKAYGVCCQKKGGVLVPHYEFAFDVPPPADLTNEILHY